MDTVPITPNLTMLRVNGWQLYVWRDEDSVTLIDTGEPGSGAQILSALPGLDRMVLTHGHVDHSGSAANCSRRPARRCSPAPVTRPGPDGRGTAASGVRGLGSAYRPMGFCRPARHRTALSVDRSSSTATCSTSAAAPRSWRSPGHTEGSLAIHLPRQGVLFTGDTIANVGTVMLGAFNQVRAQTVASFRRLAALDVETACFGHGEPIASGAGTNLREVAATLMP